MNWSHQDAGCIYSAHGIQTLVDGYEKWLYKLDGEMDFRIQALQKKVYMRQLLGFESHDHPNYVYEFGKALYSLK